MYPGPGEHATGVEIRTRRQQSKDKPGYGGRTPLPTNCPNNQFITNTNARSSPVRKSNIESAVPHADGLSSAAISHAAAAGLPKIVPRRDRTACPPNKDATSPVRLKFPRLRPLASTVVHADSQSLTRKASSENRPLLGHQASSSQSPPAQMITDSPHTAARSAQTITDHFVACFSGAGARAPHGAIAGDRLPRQLPAASQASARPPRRLNTQLGGDWRR